MKKFIYVLFLVFTTLTYAQKYELGNVTLEELKEKVCPSDSSAVASYLFNIGKTFFEYSGSEGFRIITEISSKIKIYKKEGYDYANYTERFYTGNKGSEKVLISKAVTYNLVGDKIEKSKLNSEGEFNEKVNKYWSRKKITLPNVKEGSIIEYKIRIESPYISNFPDWDFQKDIPVNHSEYTTKIPEYFFFNTYTKGYFSPEITNTSEQRAVDYHYYLNQDEAMKQGSNTGRVSSTLEFKEAIIKYKMINIPALKQEAFVNNKNNYRASIAHELAGTRYPNDGFKSFSTNWESVVKEVFDNENFGNELNKTGYFENEIDQLLKGITTQNDKIIPILEYVKSRVNWNEYYGIYCDGGVKKAFQDKTGNSAEINLMLTAMLRYAGFEANPILLSTRFNGISLFPTRTAFNMVIAGIELQDNVIMLDATNKYSYPNILPIQDLNWFGRIIRKNGSSAEIDLMPKSNSKDIVNIMATIQENGDVTGKIRDQYFDYNAFVFRQNYNTLSKESYIEKLEKQFQGLEIGEYNVQNRNDLNLPIVENYDFTTTNAVEIIGDKMYVSPFLFFAQTDNPFKQEKREYPIDFVYPDQDKYMVSLTIPQGYVLETLPQPKALAMPDNLANFKYNISTTGNQIQLIYTHDTNQAIIGSEYYEELKGFYKEIVDKQTEKIVLKKG